MIDFISLIDAYAETSDVTLKALITNYKNWYKKSLEKHSWPYDEYVAEMLEESKLALLKYIKVL